MNTINEDLINPIIEPVGEKAHRLVRATLSTIPVLGGPIVEAFTAIIEPPMTRRRNIWMEQVTHAINNLLERNILTEDSIQNNEAFLSILLSASNLAVKNHQKEKIDALRNAVLNTALLNAPDESIQQMFLKYIDESTVWHIAFLHLFKEPQLWSKDNNMPFPTSWNMGGIHQVIEFAFPALIGNNVFYNLIWKDLFQKGLLDTENVGAMMTVQGMLSKRTSPLGDDFIKFISSP